MIKLSTDDKTRQKIFLNQSNSLTDYGIKLKYPEVIYKDACVIADILSSYDPSEILSFTKPIGEQKKISIQNINKYYTYLDASVDYVLSIEIIVKDCLITQYSYTYKPNMSDVIISYTCVFTYDKNNLYRSLKSKDKHAFVVLENGIVKGLFVFIILPDDRYVEMLIGFTKVEEVFTEMLEYIENNYCGYQMDFVFNPLNTAIFKPLKLKGAIFEPEQMKMIQDGSVPNVSTNSIKLLSDKLVKQYCDLHSTDTYWTAERILLAQDKFRVLLAVKDGQVLGYLDVQCCYEINEIYALSVRPEAAQQGYDLALLVKAIELNRPNQMMVVVDADAEEEIGLLMAGGKISEQ